MWWTSLSPSDAADHQLSKEFCGWAPPSSPLTSVRSMVPFPSRAHVRDLLQQYVVHWQVFIEHAVDRFLASHPSLTRSNFEISPILRSACVYTAIIFAVDQTSLCERMACYCALVDRCHADALIAEFAHFFGATSGPFIAVWATPWNPHAFLEAARLFYHIISRMLRSTTTFCNSLSTT